MSSKVSGDTFFYNERGVLLVKSIVNGKVTISDVAETNARRINKISEITFRKYAFRVYDWDLYRGGPNSSYAVGGIQFKREEDEKLAAAATCPCGFRAKSGDVIFKNLRNLTDEAVAELFSNIFKQHLRIQSEKGTFWAESMHVSGLLEHDPYIHILGCKVNLPRL